MILHVAYKTNDGDTKFQAFKVLVENIPDDVIIDLIRKKYDGTIEKIIAADYIPENVAKSLGVEIN